jgi:hypothetical protein
MSAIPPKADMDQPGCDVRFVPKADNVRRSNLMPSLLQSTRIQEANLIIRRRQRIADDLASEVQIAQHKRAANIPLPVPCLRFGAGQLGAEHHAALRIGRTPDH